jgi:predicted branched-subunit amino acid permease
VFSATGGYESPQAFTDGVVSALPIAVAVLAVGFVLALLVPGRGSAARRTEAPAAAAVPQAA